MLFFALAGGGAFFLFLALFVFLPVVILAPSKFAMAFTIGCCLVLSAFAALKGWRKQAAQMLARDRLPFTAGYLGSVVLTLYASIFMHSYLLSLGASALQARGVCVRVFFWGGRRSAKVGTGTACLGWARRPRLMWAWTLAPGPS